MSVPLCGCNVEAALKSVSKANANKGRRFWGCCSYPKRCEYFQWADEEAAPATPTTQAEHIQLAPSEQAPLCNCGIAAAQRQVRKEGATKGRLFWRCSKNEAQCRYFAWIDQPSNETPPRHTAAQPQRTPGGYSPNTPNATPQGMPSRQPQTPHQRTHLPQDSHRHSQTMPTSQSRTPRDSLPQARMSTPAGVACPELTEQATLASEKTGLPPTKRERGYKETATSSQEIVDTEVQPCEKPVVDAGDPANVIAITDWAERGKLARLFSVEPAVLQASTLGHHDTFSLEKCWKIDSTPRINAYQAAKSRLRERLGGSALNTLDETAHALFEASDQLSAIEDCETDIGELLFFIGVPKVTNLDGILRGVKSPARHGTYGVACYLNENMVAVDLNTPESKLAADGTIVHRLRAHASNLCFVILARAALGKARVVDQTTPTSAIFTDTTRTSLLGDYESLLIAQHREFVVHDADRVLPEYLLAYRRSRSFCDCGVKAVKSAQGLYSHPVWVCPDGNCAFEGIATLDNADDRPAKRQRACSS